MHAKTRLRHPEYRAPGSDSWEQVSWDCAIERIAKLVKDDRDKNFIVRNKDGQLVNRWTIDRVPRRVRDHQRDRVPHLQGRARLGMVVFDNQARV